MDQRTKTFRIVGIVIFIDAAAICFMRILINLLPITNEWAADAAFSLPLQLGFSVIVPLLIFKFALKNTLKDSAELSNMRKTKPINYLLGAALGFFNLFATIGISMLWLLILVLFGYTPSSSALDLSDSFQLWQLLLAVFLICVLPGFCEEFATRGAFLTQMREIFGTKHAILITGMAFGLMHCYAPQTFYTMIFGGVLAFVVISTKSIYPAMIAHFMSNFVSVYLDFAEKYGWFGGNMFSALQAALLSDPSIVLVMFVFAIALVVGTVYLIYAVNKTQTWSKKLEKIKQSAFDNTHNRVAIVGKFDEKEIADLDMTKEVFGESYKEDRFKPTLRDLAFYIGALVITASATIFSFIWGLF